MLTPFSVNDKTVSVKSSAIPLQASQRTVVLNLFFTASKAVSLTQKSVANPQI